LSLSLLIILHELDILFLLNYLKPESKNSICFLTLNIPYLKIGETEYGIDGYRLVAKISGMIDESMDKEQMVLPPQPEFRSKPAYQRLIMVV
jgi:regulator of sigma E protease